MFAWEEISDIITQNYKQYFTIALMIIYTLYALRQIFGYRRLACGIAGTAALIAGEVVIYLIGPTLAMAILRVITIAFIVLVVWVLFEPTETGK